MTIPSGKTLTIPAENTSVGTSAGKVTVPANKTLTISANATLTNEGTITISNTGTLTNNGTIINKGTITNNGTFIGNQPLVPTDYVNAAGQSQGPQNAIEVTESTASWSGGWYVAKGDVTISQNVTFNGNVNLILADGCKITVTGSITGKNGSGSSLTIYGQSGGTGELHVTNTITGDTGKGVEGGDGNGGNITINGGMVEAATISGGNGSHSPEGNCGNGGNVTINGGAVTATGSISGGDGGSSASTGGNGGNVIISGGMVEVATIFAGDGGMIGGFDHGPSGSFKTQEENATSKGNAVIFASWISDKSNQSNWSGVVFEGDSGKVYGTSAITPTESFTIDNGKTLTIESGKTLTLSGITAVNNGSVYVDGTLSGTFDGNGAVYYPLTLVDATATGSAEGDISPLGGKTYGKVGGTVVLTPVAKTGYKLSGWSVTSGDQPTPIGTGSYNFTMPSAAVAVTAKYAPCSYGIAYELDGGTINSGDVTSYTYGQGATLPTDVTKTGCTFAGWFDNADCTGTAVTEISSTATGEKTFYAKWLSQDTSVQKVAVKGVDATVDNANRTVEITLPYNVALPTVGSDFEIVTTSDKAQKTEAVKEGDVWKFVVTAEDSNCSATYTVTVKQQPAPYVPPTYNVPATGEGGIAVRVTVSGSTAVVAEISALALVSAAGSGAESITIDLSGLPKGVTQAQLTKSSVDKLLAVVNDNDNAVESVTVNLGGAVLTIDAKALAAVAGQVKGANVTLGVKESTSDSLNSAQKHALSPFEVVQLYFTAQVKSGGAEVHDFGGGAVRVSAAFEPRAGHDPARYVVLYVGEDGQLERYATAWADGMLSFIAPHFSAYAVVYVEDEALVVIEALEAVPDAGELKASQAKEAVKRAEDALAGYTALDDGQKMLVDEALVANAESVVAKGAELIEQADAKAVGKVKNKKFSVKYGKKKVIYFKTKISAAGTKVVYEKVRGSKYITVTQSGKVTAKKGLKKGWEYVVTVKVTCGDAYKYVKVTVRVR